MLFRICMVVTTFVDGEVVLVATGSTVVNTVVGTVAGTVNSVVGNVVGLVVGGVVASAGTAGWVHPAKKIQEIKRITKLIYFFITVNCFCFN